MCKEVFVLLAKEGDFKTKMCCKALIISYPNFWPARSSARMNDVQNLAEEMEDEVEYDSWFRLFCSTMYFWMVCSCCSSHACNLLESPKRF